MAKVQNGEEILAKISTHRVGHTTVTDDRWICDSKDLIVVKGVREKLNRSHFLTKTK